MSWCGSTSWVVPCFCEGRLQFWWQSSVSFYWVVCIFRKTLSLWPFLKLSLLFGELTSSHSCLLCSAARSFASIWAQFSHTRPIDLLRGLNFYWDVLPSSFFALLQLLASYDPIGPDWPLLPPQRRSRVWQLSVAGSWIPGQITFYELLDFVFGNPFHWVLFSIQCALDFWHLFSFLFSYPSARDLTLGVRHFLTVFSSRRALRLSVLSTSCRASHTLRSTLLPVFTSLCARRLVMLATFSDAAP